MCSLGGARFGVETDFWTCGWVWVGDGEKFLVRDSVGWEVVLFLDLRTCLFPLGAEPSCRCLCQNLFFRRFIFLLSLDIFACVECFVVK